MSKRYTQLITNVANQIYHGGVKLTVKDDAMIAPLAGEYQTPMHFAEGEAVISEEGLVKHCNQYFTKFETNPFTTSMEEADTLGDTVVSARQAIMSDIKPIAVGIIAKIKDQIIPTVNSIFEKAYNKTQEMTDSGRILLGIKTDGSEHPLWSHPKFLAILDQAGGEGGLPELGLVGVNLPAKTPEELLQLVMSAAADLGECLSDALGEDALTIVESVYASVFNGGGTIHDHQCPRLELLVAILLAVALREDIPEGVTGVDSPAAYRKHLDEVISTGTLRLSQLVKHHAQRTKSDRLVINYPANGGVFKAGECIIVNGLLFEAWLESGGTVDAIYGSYVTDQNPRGSVIMENKEQLERAWLRRVALAQSAVKDDFERVFVNNLRAEIYNHAKETNMGVDDDGIEKMYERSSSINPDNAYPFTRRIVVATLFDDGEYLAVLEAIDGIQQRVPDIDLNDAIDLGIIDWLVEWALDQCKIKRR